MSKSIIFVLAWMSFNLIWISQWQNICTYSVIILLLFHSDFPKYGFLYPWRQCFSACPKHVHCAETSEQWCVEANNRYSAGTTLVWFRHCFYLPVPKGMKRNPEWFRNVHRISTYSNYHGTCTIATVRINPRVCPNTAGTLILSTRRLRGCLNEIFITFCEETVTEIFCDANILRGSGYSLNSWQKLRNSRRFPLQRICDDTRRRET